MTKKTLYICDHCLGSFDEPCEKHEIECLAKKERIDKIEKAAAKVEPLCNILLGEKMDNPVWAKINGVPMLIATPFSKKAIKSFSGATELISTEAKPSDRDIVLLKKVNSILAL